MTRVMFRRGSKTMLVVLLVIATAGGAYATVRLGQESAGDNTSLSKEKQEIEADLESRRQEWEKELEDPEARDEVLREKAEGKSAHAESAVPDPVVAWPTGIFDDSEAPAPGSVFLASNRWVGTIDGVSVALYAGVAGDDNTLGRILVMRADEAKPSGFFDMPGSGRLSVVDAKDANVTILGGGGKRYEFDVREGTWN